MDIYILHTNMWRPGGDGDHYESEVVAVASTLALAQKRAQDRDGGTLKWTEHNSHGLCWVADRGRMGVWSLSYTIELQELIKD